MKRAHKTPVELPSHALRVAMVWGDAVQGESLLREPAAVVLGYGEAAQLPLADGQDAMGDVTLMSPAGDGSYHLHLPPQARGAVWLQGQRREVSELLATTPTLRVGAGDHGVVSLGPASYFFQFVAQPTRTRPVGGWLEGDTALSVGLSLFLHVVVLLLMLMAYRESPPEQTLELPHELIASFMATPPPEERPPETAPESGDETEDPGLEKKQDSGGKRQKRESGRVGREDAKQERTELKDPVADAVVRKVRGVGVLGALAGGNALASALEAPSVSEVLGGLGSVRNVTGRGAGGTGLRGVGKGGGGDGEGGGLFGAGKLGTGAGAGAGGAGKGKGGPGARGKPRKEVKVSVSTGKPAVNGFLSPEQINRVVRRNQAALRYCYESEVQRQRGLRGRLMVQWRIDTSGRVTSARVAKSSLNNARVEGCVVRQVRKWRFPRPDGGEVQVLYPFIFGVGG